MTQKIFNIFSKKSKKEKKKPRVIIDHRERNSLVASILVSLGIEIEFRELKVGDYVVKDVVIERKTILDFISSMKNKRLINQLEELQQYKNKLLIIEGIDEDDLYTDSADNGIHSNAIRGFLLSIILRYKVPIIFTKNQEDTAKFIFILSKRDSKEVSLNVAKKALNKKERKQFIIESFQGIGPKTAKKLLKEFKTIDKILNAPEEKLRKVIGKKAEVFKIVRERY